MPFYRVAGEITRAATAYIEADNPSDARAIFEGREWRAGDDIDCNGQITHAVANRVDPVGEAPSAPAISETRKAEIAAEYEQELAASAGVDRKPHAVAEVVAGRYGITAGEVLEWAKATPQE